MNYIKKYLNIFSFLVLFSGLYLSSSFFQKVYGESKVYKITNAKVYQMYKKIVAQTGQIQDALPLVIAELPVVNAYNDGYRVVLYRGLIDAVQNDDELALIIGHEIAHGMLKHVYYQQFQKSTKEIAVAEANADKLGAYYIMRAGYDLCIARKFWDRMRHESGNYLNEDHPDYSYRYDELNINCDKRN